MKPQTLLIALAIALAVGSILGYNLKGCAGPKPPAADSTAQTNTAAISDAERAVVYADGYVAGKTEGAASVRPVVKYVTLAGKTERVTEYDETAIALAEQYYRAFDSLMCVRAGEQDIVAHDVVDLSPYHTIEAFFGVRGRSFGGTTVTCTKPDVTETVEVARDRTFWQRFGWGPQAQVTLVSFAPGKTTWFPGGSLGFGIHYSF